MFFQKSGDGLTLQEQAVAHIKANKCNLLEEFAADSVYPPQEEPISIFMAGSPGAGKTEFSKQNQVDSYDLNSAAWSDIPDVEFKLMEMA